MAFGAQNDKGFTLWFTGLSGAGKTTVSKLVEEELANRRRRLEILDGDVVRENLSKGLGFSKEDRDTNIRRIAFVADLLSRNGVPVIAQGSGADSASVIFDALQTARSRGAEVLVADTAGRLHTQSGLMDELAKIRRVLGKLDAEAPHETLLVIDGTTGQNAVNQVRQFRAAIGVTGLVVTKLDGTAKGGVIFALAKEFGLPVRFVGLGESLDDLREFDAAAFVDGLLPPALGA